MNLDFEHFNGNPSNLLLSGIPTIRVEFKCRIDLGENPIQKANALKEKIDREYPDKKVILVFTHRSGFEGRYKRWEEFGTPDWERWTEDWIAVLAPVFAIFASNGKYIFQIGNEPDPPITGKSVIIPPVHYGAMFRRSYSLIKHLNANVKVITAGFKSGAFEAYNYFVAANIKDYDGFGLHLYGAGARNNPNFKLGGGTNHMENHLDFLRNRNIKNIYLTEFGVLDNPNASALLVTQYIKDFMRVALSYPQVIHICYYAWGEKMDNGWGLGTNSQTTHINAKKELEYSRDEVIIAPSFPFVKTYINVARNIRSEPKIDNNVLILFNNPKNTLYINERSAELADGYIWKEIIFGSIKGWMAFDNTMTRRIA